MVGKVLTWARIEELFDGEWVLLEDPETEENLLVKSGKLLWHSKSREEIGRKALELRPTHSAVLYIGSPPKDATFLLSVYL